MKIKCNNGDSDALFWKKIKSKYILQKIFANLNQTKILELIRYNKMIKNKLNIIKYNYLKEYSKIEVEIYPKENTSDNFINIDDENKSYYHIYFNNERKEVKKYNYNEKDKINKIKIIIDYEVKTLDRLFESCNCIKSITITIRLIKWL